MDTRTKSELRKHLRAIRVDFSAKTANPSLAAYCAICSYEIWKHLKQKKLNPEFRYSYCISMGHCFVTCNGYLIDITARQFGKKYPLVSIRKFRNGKNPWFWKKDAEKATTVSEIKDLLCGWPYEQKPREISRRLKKK